MKQLFYIKAAILFFVLAPSTRTIAADVDAYLSASTMSSDAETPPALSVDDNCGNSVIHFTEAPAGTTFYWQDSEFGESMDNSDNDRVVTQTGTYYLRAYDGTWSSARSVYVSIAETPETPIADDATVVDEGYAHLSTNPIEGATIEWLNNNTDASVGEGPTFNPWVTENTTYKLRSFNTFCTSEPSLVNVTVLPLTFNVVVQFPVGVSGSGTLDTPYTVNGSSQNGTVQLECNTQWNITNVPAWITFTAESGTGNSEIQFSVAPYMNASTAERTASFTLTAASQSKQVYITQNSFAFSADVLTNRYVSTNSLNNPNEIFVQYVANEIVININTEIDYTLETEVSNANEPWLKGSQFIGDQGALRTVKVPFDANKKQGTRTGKIHFKTGGITFLSYDVNQSGIGAYPNGTPDLNYVMTTAYGENGVVIGQGIQYSDKLGKPIQSVSRNMADDMVMVSQPVYDNFGRVEYSPMTAPVVQKSLGYVNNYITENTLKSLNELEPDDLLGMYFSDANTEEPMVPADEKPFSKVVYSQSIPGALSRSHMAGDETSGKYVSGFTVSASPDELGKLELNKHLNLNTLQAPGEVPYTGITKSVSKDVMGKEAITYYNAQGQAIASCMSSSTANSYLWTNTIKTDGETQAYIDIHLPAGQAGYTLTRSSDWDYDVVNLETDGATQNLTNLKPGCYRIVYYPGGASNPENPTFSYNTCGYSYHSFNAYDAAGRLVRSLSPKAVAELSTAFSDENLIKYTSRNTYNSMGWLLSSSSHDEGRTEYLYRKDGKIRFSQNEKQRELNKFSYTNYDKDGRIVEVGEVKHDGTGGNFTTTNADLIPLFDRYYANSSNPTVTGLGLTGATYYDQTFSYYGKPDPDAPITQEFMRGKVSKTWNSNVQTWYSYTYLGQVAKVAQKIEGMDIDNNGIENDDDLITLEYTYDYLGNVIVVNYIAGTNLLVPLGNGNVYMREHTFTHFYEYDLNNRLEAVYTRRFNAEKELQARYHYYQHGPLKRVELADGLQGIDYTYTIQGWLKAINNPQVGSTYDPGHDGDQLFSHTITSSDEGTLYTRNIPVKPGDDIHLVCSITGISDDFIAISMHATLLTHSGEQIELGSASKNTDGLLELTPSEITEAGLVKVTVNKSASMSGKTIKVILNYSDTVTGQTLADVFGMALDYYSGDYTRTASNMQSNGSLHNNYDGNIARQRWYTKGLSNGQAVDEQDTWSYAYDERNFLASASFGTSNSITGDYTVNSNAAYQVYGSTFGTPIIYDKNGNIEKLSRKDGNGSVMDQFTYNYTGLNRLNYIVDGSEYNVAGIDDLKTQNLDNYKYNNIGQLTDNVSDGHYFEYDVYGKTKYVYTDAAKSNLLATYIYDDKGFRVCKIETKLNTTTWYVRDASGNILTTYTKATGTTDPLLRTEIPIYGSGRIGLASFDTKGEFAHNTYELNDHLGNVRATLAKNYTTNKVLVLNSTLVETSDQAVSQYLVLAPGFNTNGQQFTARIDPSLTATTEQGRLLTATDYYPFGMPMPGRLFFATDKYRFGYQGQFAEKDKETGYNQFEARLYDARIGRWLNVDPWAYRYLRWSPYNMGFNNPIKFIDSNGKGPKDRVTAANSLLGKAYLQQSGADLRTASTPEALKYMDCSESINRIMAADLITDGVKDMRTDILMDYFKDASKFQIVTTGPQAGDIMLFKGHVSFVFEANGEKVKALAGLGKGKNLVKNSTFQPPSVYGSSFIGYVRPIIETPDDGDTYGMVYLKEIIITGKGPTPRSEIVPEVKIY